MAIKTEKSRTPTPTAGPPPPPTSTVITLDIVPTSPKSATTLLSNCKNVATTTTTTPTSEEVDKPKDVVDPPEATTTSLEDNDDNNHAIVEKLNSIKEEMIESPNETKNIIISTVDTTKTEIEDIGATTVNKVKEEKYNPLSITNLLRKEPMCRRSTQHQLINNNNTCSPGSMVSKINGSPSSSFMIEKSIIKNQEQNVTKDQNNDDHYRHCDFSPATGLIGQNLSLLATIQQLHCQVMLALTERIRPSSDASTSTSPIANRDVEGGTNNNSSS